MIFINDLNELEHYKDYIIKNEDGLILNVVYQPYIPLMAYKDGEIKEATGKLLKTQNRYNKLE